MMTNRPAARTPSSTLKKFSVSDREILDRRVKTNPRYAAVQPRTNTGFNTHRRQELDREIRKYYKVRNDEEFRRISLGDLIQLMVTHSMDAAAAAAEEGEVEEEEEEEEEQKKEEEDEERREVNCPLKYLDNLQKVVHGMENLMAKGTRPPPARPYLILDIRAPQEYASGHIATAVNHPSARLSRAVGWENDALLTHKNRPGVVIAVCDESEDAAPSAVSILQHRGYTNVLLLSGGTRLARDKIGPPLLTADSSVADLPLGAAVMLQTQLASTVLPPLSVSDGAQWWAATAPTTNAMPAGTSRTTHRSLEPPNVSRPPPWR